MMVGGRVRGRKDWVGKETRRGGSTGGGGGPRSSDEGGRKLFDLCVKFMCWKEVSKVEGGKGFQIIICDENVRSAAGYDLKGAERWLRRPEKV